MTDEYGRPDPADRATAARQAIGRAPQGFGRSAESLELEKRVKEIVREMKEEQDRYRDFQRNPAVGMLIAHDRGRIELLRENDTPAQRLEKHRRHTQGRENEQDRARER
ncbi:hypothetical protein [Nocardia suismassiliense]|uniref:hypothetical protein n=1 Tax=Nocardia suismassiliense TaxID=2077092 RepID=UPI000D1EB7FE|nr:hypothetical protein [Nocardia suismassiliense]